MILLTKASSKEAKKCGLTEYSLRQAVDRAVRGRVDARLNSTVIKQQISRPPEGRKTACRAIIAFKEGEPRKFIMHVYAKSAKSDLTPRESEAFFDLSKQLFALSTETIAKLIRERGWKDIENAEGKEI